MSRRRRRSHVALGSGSGGQALDINLIMLSGYLDAIANPSATIEQLLLLGFDTPNA
jgi:hypothetical protein